MCASKNSQIRGICISVALFFILRPQNFEMLGICSFLFSFLLIYRKNPALRCGIFACISFVNETWCARRESNPHALASTGT